jgi:hypothetical protein
MMRLWFVVEQIFCSNAYLKFPLNRKNDIESDWVGNFNYVDEFGIYKKIVDSGVKIYLLICKLFINDVNSFISKD